MADETPVEKVAAEYKAAREPSSVHVEIGPAPKTLCEACGKETPSARTLLCGECVHRGMLWAAKQSMPPRFKVVKGVPSDASIFVDDLFEVSNPMGATIGELVDGVGESGGVIMEIHPNERAVVRAISAVRRAVLEKETPGH
jgi:hypothetical protein